eukprot:7727465-Ditylum_brightwellii.AAC.1
MKNNKALDPVLGEAPCPDQRTFSKTDRNTLGQLVGTNPKVDMVAMSAALDWSRGTRKRRSTTQVPERAG